MIIAQHICSFLLGIVGIIHIPLGLWMWKRPPRRIKSYIGYRTRRSMKSQAAWDFAQVYSGKVLFYCGIALVVLALLCLPVTAVSGFTVFIPTLLVLAFTMLPLYLTERKLKTQFDQQH